MIFEKKHYSIKAGKTLRLTNNQDVVLTSNNPEISCANGAIRADRDIMNLQGQAVISAKDSEGTLLDTCEVTVVSWEVNNNRMEITRNLDTYSSMVEVDGWVYGFSGNILYRSNDGFASRVIVGTANMLPTGKILKTPYGFFARYNNSAGAVYRSDDLLNWTMVFSSGYRGLYHMFDYYMKGSTLYIYLGEYTTEDPTRRHKVYRGVINSKTDQTWGTVLEFKSVKERQDNPDSTEPSARHIHVVQVDPFTGDIYVNTGDDNPESQHMISQDNGATWRTLGKGTQEWRCLSFWFTKDYIYWNMDTSSPQAIFRLKRTNLNLQNVSTDYREKIGDFVQGSMWYHAWVKDLNGDNVLIMGVSAEGKWRDMKARLLCVKENKNSVDVTEVFLSPSATPTEYVAMAQLEPLFQDKLGNIYFNTRSLNPAGIWQMRFKTGYKQKQVVFKNPFK